MTTGVGTTLTMGYDGLRRLTSVTGGPVSRQFTYRDIDSTKTTMQVASVTSGGQQYGYTYDSMGNIATYSAPGKGTVTYTYDNQGQLLSATGDTTYTYTYDGAGNILTANGHTYTYGDTTWKDLLTAFDGNSISYDAIGNPTSYYNGTRWTMTWTGGRNLTNAAAGGNSLSFAYNANGLRTSKTVNGVTYQYYYASGKLMRMTWGANTIDFFYDANGTPYAMKYNGTVYYYVTNLQGDVMRIVNASGTVMASYDYDPYGKVISATGTLASVNPLRYRGYVYDQETGFYYLQSRYYDPAIGRFLNVDSQISGIGGEPIEYNMFAYCGSNPVNKVDNAGEDGKYYDLGRGWECRIEQHGTGAGQQRHIHIWNEQKGIQYAQNDDGSPHDKNNNNQGKLPKWLQKVLKSKTGWDYNGNRSSFFEKTRTEYWAEGTQYTFADGTTAFRSYSPFMMILDGIDFFEKMFFESKASTSNSNNIKGTFYLPTIFGHVTLPSFSFGFSWGMPIPHLY